MTSSPEEPARTGPAPGEPYEAPLVRGRFFGLRFPGTLEAEFRAHYRRAFARRMQALWYVAVVAWVVAGAADVLFFPDAAPAVRVFRLAGLAPLLLTALAVSFPDASGERLHLLTTLGGLATGLCAIGVFAAAPAPQRFPFLLTLVAVCVASTIFAATLHYEHSAAANLALVAAFAVYAFAAPSVPLASAVGLTLGLVAVTGMSLACTNTIEQYARANFAQRRALEAQSAALAEKARELEASESKARDANLAKSVFLSNMSHELRTPLNAVLGFAQLLGRDPSLSAEGRENLRIIGRSGDHLLALINDVLAISKIEAGRVALTERAFDLEEMIVSVADMIRVRTDAKGLRLVVSTFDLPKAVVGDEGKLRQVLVNLLGNAVKFTDAGGVALRAAWRDSAAVIEIEDTGYGIAPDEVGALFEAFAQTESGRRSKEGTGLGLAISRNFVRLMGGDISVTSELGRGTTFTVEAPMREAEDAAAGAAPPRVARLAPGQPPMRLLVVDDTADNRRLLRALLEPVGFEVREAADGREAVDAWRAWRPHLVWMDIRMPVLDGYEATRLIRAEETESAAAGSDAPARCRILALTASAFQHEREKILEGGFDDFVTKPFREETIFEKLAEHLGARFVSDEPAAPSPEPAGDGASATFFARLAALPPDLLAILRDAMIAGDVEEAGRTAEHIRERDEGLGVELQRMIKSFRFDELLEAIE